MKVSTTKILSCLILAGGLVFIAQSCIDSKGEEKSIPKSSEPIPVKLISLQQSVSGNYIVTSGQITTDDETTLAFKTGGVVKSVYIKEGDKVVKGQLLATLDLTEIESLTSQAKLAYEKAERDLNRTKNLFQDSVATLEQLQNVQTAYELAKAQYSSASFNKSFSQIKAPANGYVLKKFVNAGQVVGVGDPIIRTNGAGQSTWILKSGLSDKQWRTIRVGEIATIKVDAFPESSFQGKVIRKSETADPSSGLFTIEIGIENGKSKFASGMFAAANIQTSEGVKSWAIPYDAVLDADGKNGFVFVTNDKQKAVKTPVIIDSFDKDNVLISSGLEGAQSLIVAGSAYLTDGSPIRIVK